MTSLRLLKLAAGGATVIALNGLQNLRDIIPHKLCTTEPIELEDLIGNWYEHARKPNRIEKRSYRNIYYQYRVNEQQAKPEQILDLMLHYTAGDGALGYYHFEADFLDQPDYRQFKIYYLPFAVIKSVKALSRQIFYYDREQQVMLIGENSRKCLWVLARDPKLDPRIVEQLLGVAAEQGFNLDDVILVKHDDDVVNV